MAFASTYAQKLRAIGQAMEGSHLEDFDIESNGNSFFVRGIKRSKAHPVSFLQALRGKSPTQDAKFLEFRYTSDEVERLEREGQARRRDPNGMPDFYNLSQMLRTVGAYIDGKQARLGKVYRRGTRLTLEFESAQAPPNIEEHTASSFYNFFVHMYLRRSGHPARK
jgi:hypothetical protein